mmetsp:Transcript_44826/g.111624  ORF Transcript_44826/g.111624 Transcript_44826/m.111624 type:complete len:212 (+) Transcript_44826:122-757(+)
MAGGVGPALHPSQQGNAARERRERVAVEPGRRSSSKEELGGGPQCVRQTGWDLNFRRPRAEGREVHARPAAWDVLRRVEQDTPRGTQPVAMRVDQCGDLGRNETALGRVPLPVAEWRHFPPVPLDAQVDARPARPGEFGGAGDELVHHAPHPRAWAEGFVHSWQRVVIRPPVVYPHYLGPAEDGPRWSGRDSHARLDLLDEVARVEDVGEL